MSEKTKAHSPCGASCPYQSQMRNAFRAGVELKTLQCPCVCERSCRCLLLVAMSESFPKEFRYVSSFGVV